MKKAIITKTPVLYDPKEGKSAKIVRAICPNRGIQFSDHKIDAYMQVFSVEEDGTLKEQPQFNNHSVYTNEQLNNLFSSLNDPIFPNESFLEEFNKLALQVLLLDTKARALFGVQEWEIYNIE